MANKENLQGWRHNKTQKGTLVRNSQKCLFPNDYHPQPEYLLPNVICHCCQILQVNNILILVLQFLLMNLEVLKHYFSFLARCQLDLEKTRGCLQLDRFNSFAYYRLIAVKSQAEIDKSLIIAFIKTFTYNFQAKQPQQLINDSGYELLPAEEAATQEELMSRGVELFLKKWGCNNTLNFEDFCQFLKQDGEIPDRSKQLEYPLKKKFYQLLEDEIQNLLNAETFRRTVCLQYRNMVDLFEMLAADGEIDIQEVKNLYLMSGQRKNEYFFELIAKRFPLPCNFEAFKRWFSLAPVPSKYKQQTKVYFSSLKRRKNGPSFDDDDEKFMTPNGKTAAAAEASSTKMTKAERLHSAKISKIEISRFTFDEGPEVSRRKNTVILADILAEEERVNELKRQLIYQQDYDLELIYQRRGKEFESLLNKRYGSCNFTSFVRYIVPQNFEHRYLAFIKYQKENRLSPDTEEKISYLLDQEEVKEHTIEQWWQSLDKEIVFRGYCRPGDRSIPNSQMKKYFTERECKILLDRLDPNKTGAISLDYFY